MKLYDLSGGGFVRLWDQDIVAIHQTKDSIAVTTTGGWHSLHAKYWDYLVELIKEGTRPALTNEQKV
jgi:hypothetical protein